MCLHTVDLISDIIIYIYVYNHIYVQKDKIVPKGVFSVISAGLCLAPRRVEALDVAPFWPGTTT